MKVSIRIGFALVAGLGLMNVPAFASAAPVPSVAVAVYRGPAGCDDCSETVRTALEHLDPRYRVDFIGPQEAIDITPATLRRYALYVQPGGGQDIPAALDSLGKARVTALRDYVAQGGRYLGLCMGAYLADANNLALIPEELDSEVGRPGFPVTTIDDAAVAVRWAGRDDQVFYQDGPYLPPSHARLRDARDLRQRRHRRGALCLRSGGGRPQRPPSRSRRQLVRPGGHPTGKATPEPPAPRPRRRNPALRPVPPRRLANRGASARPPGQSWSSPGRSAREPPWVATGLPHSASPAGRSAAGWIRSPRGAGCAGDRRARSC